MNKKIKFKVERELKPNLVIEADMVEEKDGRLSFYDITSYSVPGSSFYKQEKILIASLSDFKYFYRGEHETKD